LRVNKIKIVHKVSDLKNIVYLPSFNPIKQIKLKTKTMKKSIFTIALALGVSGVFAQDLTSKKGEPILPEAEDWAISMNADPIFEFVGNSFNGNTSNSAPGAKWLNSNQTIVGKKFIDATHAYRVLVRIGLNSSTYKHNVDQDNAPAATFPSAAPIVTDKLKKSNTTVGIGVGKEWRRGKTRLQGYYGADVMIWLSSSKDKYTWGNAMATTASAGNDPSPTSTAWSLDADGNTTGEFGSDAALSSRKTEVKSGMTFGIGVRGFIGAEYFIFPKIAIGAEYGWGLGFQSKGKGKSTEESIGGTTPAVGSTTTETAGNSKFGIDTDLNQNTMFGFKGSNTGTASLRVTLHF
jgi:hypothetical protein